MIRCPKCGADNMIGAIFCRTCGERLNLDEIRPEQELAKQKQPAKVQTIITRLVTLVIFLVIAGIIGMILLPNPGGVKGEIDAAAQKRLTAQWQIMTKGHWRRPHKFQFNSDEVTAAANQVLGLGGSESDSGSKGLVPEHISIELLSSGYVKMVLRTRLFGKLHIDNTLIGRFSGGDSGVTFTPFSASMGKLGLPGPLKSVVVKRFAALVQGHGDLETLAARIQKVDVEDDMVALTLK